MGKQKNNYYVLLLKGKEPEILTSWDECERKMKGTSRPIYHGFPTKEETEDFINGKWRGNPVSEEALRWLEGYKTKAEQLKPETELDTSALSPSDGAVAYVDGSYNEERKRYGFGVVFLNNGKIETLYGGGQDKELAKMGCGAGEMLACMEAIKHAETLGITNLTIKYDSQLIPWAFCGCGQDMLVQAASQYMYEIREKMELTVENIKGLAHIGENGEEEPGNVLADKLAKTGAGIAEKK